VADPDRSPGSLSPVPYEPDLAPAIAALDDCDAALRKLDAGCCEPGRSPRMQALSEALASIRAEVDLLDAHEAPDALLGLLENAGAQVGSLQVGCCTAQRLPLYARLLEGLTVVQLTVNRAAGRSHDTAS
jgi:hypothetical protein